MILFLVNSVNTMKRTVHNWLIGVKLFLLIAIWLTVNHIVLYYSFNTYWFYIFQVIATMQTSILATLCIVHTPTDFLMEPYLPRILLLNTTILEIAQFGSMMLEQRLRRLLIRILQFIEVIILFLLAILFVSTFYYKEKDIFFLLSCSNSF